MNRGVEIDSEVPKTLDRSLIREQVEMGVAVRMVPRRATRALGRTSRGMKKIHHRDTGTQRKGKAGSNCPPVCHPAKGGPGRADGAVALESACAGMTGKSVLEVSRMMSKPLKTLARPLAILNARLLDPASKRDEHGGILVQDGVIADVGRGEAQGCR